MSITITRTQHIRGAVAAAGASLPEAVDQAARDLDTLTELARAFTSPTNAQIQDALAEAMLEGRDPLDDAQLRRLTTAQALTGNDGRAVAYGVPQAGERRLVAALVEHADDILVTLHEAAAKHSANLSTAHALIGDVDLTEADQILRLGPNAARAWAEARDAVQELKIIDRAWTSLAELTRFASSSTEPALRLAALTLEQFDQVGRKADAWAIVRAGAVIDLADRTTIRERTQALSHARQTRSAVAADGFRQQYRRSQGVAS